MSTEDQYTSVGSHSRSAWRVLAPLYLGTVLGLMVVCWFQTPRNTSSFEDRLQRLSTDEAATSLDAALQKADTGRALMPDDEARAQRFLLLQAQAAGMLAEEVTFRPGISTNGMRPVEARLVLVGDPYHLPIFLDGLYRQRAINHPLSVQASGGGRQVRFVLRIRYHRPALSDVDWVAARMIEQWPAAVQYTPMLQQAARLMEWQHFRSQERRLTEEANRTRKTIARELAPALIALRASGERLSWSSTVEEEG